MITDEQILEYQKHAKQMTAIEGQIYIENESLLGKYVSDFLAGKYVDSDTRADYMQQSYFAMQVALRKFDPGKGRAFTSYLRTIVYRKLDRYRAGDRMIEIPERIQTIQKKIIKLAAEDDVSISSVRYKQYCEVYGEESKDNFRHAKEWLGRGNVILDSESDEISDDS